MGESVDCIEIEDDFDIEVEDNDRSSLNAIRKRIHIGNWLLGLGIANLILIGGIAIHFIGVGMILTREAERWIPETFLEEIFAGIIVGAMLVGAMFFILIGCLILILNLANLGFILGALNIKGGSNYFLGKKTIFGMVLFCTFVAVACIVASIYFFDIEGLSFPKLLLGSFIIEIIIIGNLFYILDVLKETRWTFDLPFRKEKPRRKPLGCMRRSGH